MRWKIRNITDRKRKRNINKYNILLIIRANKRIIIFISRLINYHYFRIPCPRKKKLNRFIFQIINLSNANRRLKNNYTNPKINFPIE